MTEDDRSSFCSGNQQLLVPHSTSPSAFDEPPHSKKPKVARSRSRRALSRGGGGGGGGGGESIIPTIPDDLVIKIFLCLPPYIIYSVMRLVCRSWRNIVNNPDFINAHLRASGGFNFLAPGFRGTQKVIDLLEMDYRDNNNNYLQYLKEWKTILRMGKEEEFFSVRDSFDGLVLVSVWRHPRRPLYRVLNPITKQHVSFTPPYRPNCGRRCSYSVFACAIGCAKFSGKYKVVYASFTLTEFNLSIYTLGGANNDNNNANAWRNIETGHISHIGASGVRNSTLSVEGFVFFHSYDDIFLLALDMEKEKIHQIRAPNQYVDVGRPRNTYMRYIKSASFLAFVFYLQGGVYDFWKLEDPINGVWEKMHRLDLNGEREESFLRTIAGLHEFTVTPIVFLLEEDIILFRVTTRLYPSYSWVVYKVKTGAMFHFFGLRLYPDVWFVHRDSLVTLK